MKNFVRLVAIGLLFVAALTAAPVRADDENLDGATINVTTTADEFDVVGAGTGCALREAIQAANTDAAFGGCNAGNGKDKILLGEVVYTLTRAGFESENEFGDLDIISNLVLQGAGQFKTVIDGNALDRVLRVSNTSRVTLSDLSITNGKTGASTGGGGIVTFGKLTLHNVSVRNNQASLFGGGIWSTGELNLNNSTIEGNQVDSKGGGIYSTGQTVIIKSIIRNNTTLASGSLGGGISSTLNSTLLLRDSILNDNTAQGHGGGLHNLATATLVNSTVSGNNALGNGGGIVNDENGALDLYSTTIANNHADSNNNGTGVGGGIWNYDCPTDCSIVNFKNTLIGDNTIKTVGATNNDCDGTLNSLGYNFIETTVGCTLDGQNDNNIINTDPLLAPLALTAGTTQTHGLQNNSLAIDAGNPAGCTDETGALLLTDQRGEPRSTDSDGINGPTCDIGAFERAISATCVAKPAQPLAGAPLDGATENGHKATLVWKNADCAAKFKIIVKAGSKKGAVVMKKANLTATQTKTKKLPFGTYVWRIIAANEFGKTRSAWATFTLSP